MGIVAVMFIGNGRSSISAFLFCHEIWFNPEYLAKHENENQVYNAA